MTSEAAVSAAPAQLSENVSITKEDNDEIRQLNAAAAQGHATVPDKYTVEDGVLYCGGAEVTEEQTTFDLRESDLEDYSFLKNYSWVEGLLIDDENLVDLDFLRDCTNLKWLELTCSASDFQVIGDLSQLVDLTLHAPNLTNLDFLSNLTLDFLLCPYNDNLVDISGLDGMTSLSFLSLFQCGAIDDFAVLSSLTGLECLYLSGTTFDDLTLIESLSSLSQLDLGSCAVDYEQFTSASYTLTKLQSKADADTVAWLETIFPDCEFT